MKTTKTIKRKEPLIFNRNDKELPLYIKGKYICKVAHCEGKATVYLYEDPKTYKIKESILHKRLKKGYLYYVKYL